GSARGRPLHEADVLRLRRRDRGPRPRGGAGRAAATRPPADGRAAAPRELRLGAGRPRAARRCPLRRFRAAARRRGDPREPAGLRQVGRGPTAMLAATALAAQLLAAPASPLLGTVAPGEHAVAFRVLGRRDAVRRDRPVQIALWLPAAEPGSKPPLAYRDYSALSLTEKELVPVAEDARAKAEAGWKSFLAERGIPEETADRWLSAPMLARPDAVPARGRFPLVLVAQGNGQSAMDQAVLAEILASRGYAVATCPSPMSISGPMNDASEI